MLWIFFQVARGRRYPGNDPTVRHHHVARVLVRGRQNGDLVTQFSYRGIIC